MHSESRTDLHSCSCGKSKSSGAGSGNESKSFFSHRSCDEDIATFISHFSRPVDEGKVDVMMRL